MTPIGGRNRWLAIALLMATSPSYGLSTGMVFPLLALALTERGVDPQTVGIVTSMFYLGGFLAAFTFGGVVRWLGLRIGCIAAITLGGLAAATFALPLSLLWLLVARLATGYSASAYYTAADAWLGGLTRIEERGRIMGTSESMRLAGLSIGPWLLLLLPAGYGFQAGAVILLASVVPAWLAGPADTGNATPAALPSLPFVRHNLAVLGVAFAGGSVVAGFNAYGAVVAQATGLSAAGMATLIWGGYAIGGVAQIALGTLGDRLGRMRVVSFATATGAAMALTLMLAGRSGLALLLLGPCAVGMGISLYSLALQRLIDRSAASERVAAAAATLIAYTFGAVLGPIAGGAAFARVGALGLYAGLLAVLVLASALGALDHWLDRHRLPSH